MKTRRAAAALRQVADLDEVVARDDDSSTVTVSEALTGKAGPVGPASSEVPGAGLVLRKAPPQSAAFAVVPSHRRRAPRGPAPTDQEGNALHVARAAAWVSVEHAAAFLDVPPVTLRRMIERNARRGEDGVVVATVDGITARKLGRAWRVLLDESWRNPSGAIHGARATVRVVSRSG